MIIGYQMLRVTEYVFGNCRPVCPRLALEVYRRFTLFLRLLTPALVEVVGVMPSVSSICNEF